MKKYGVRDTQPWIYVVPTTEWADVFHHCKDTDGKFGTDDINEAYRFCQNYSDKPGVEVFEK